MRSRIRFCLLFVPFKQAVPYWIFILQLSYTDKDDNGARLAAVVAWAGGNMPPSDADPQHADQVMLITGCVYNKHKRRMIYQRGQLFLSLSVFV